MTDPRTPDPSDQEPWPHPGDAPSQDVPWGPYAGRNGVVYGAQPQATLPGPPAVQQSSPDGPLVFHTTTAPTIENYRTPRRTGLWIGIGAVVLVLALVLGYSLYQAAHPAQAPVPTPAAGSATPSTTIPGQPFQMPSDPSSTGVWQVVDRRWTSTGVSVHVRVTAVTGTCSYGFYAFASGATDLTQPAAGPDSPRLRTGTLNAGEVADGYVFFPMTRGNASIILSTALGRQISALPIAG